MFRDASHQNADMLVIKEMDIGVFDFESVHSFRIDIETAIIGIISGPLVKWSRRHPFTVKSWVRLPYGSPENTQRNLGVFYFFRKADSCFLKRNMLELVR